MIATPAEFYAMAARGPRPRPRTSDDDHPNDKTCDEFVHRIRAERAKLGLPPTIQSPKVYLLLGAVLDAQREKAEAERARNAVEKPNSDRQKNPAPER